jgi:MFS family permease
MFLYLTLYIQNILGFTPLESGLRFLPVTLLSFFVAPIAGKFAERVGIRWFLGAGLLCVGIGELLMRGLTPGDEWTALLPGFILAGIGIGLVNPPLATAAVGVVEPQRAGMASGINSTFRQVGIATGIAALGAIFQHVVAQNLIEGAHGRLPRGVTGSQAADFVSFGGFRQLHNAALNRLAEQSFVDGLNQILLIAAIVAIVGAVLSALLTRPKDFVAHGAPPAAEAEAIAA